MSRMLTVEALDVAYGEFQVLWQAEMRVDAGETTLTQLARSS